MLKLSLRHLLFYLSSLFLYVFSQSGFAAAYQLFEINAFNTGDGGAGGAAIAYDATTAFDNPAGLVRLPCPELVVSAVGIKTNILFDGSNTWRSTLLPPQLSFTEVGFAKGGSFAVLPTFYLAIPLCHNFWFGFSSSSTYGLLTRYRKISVVRYSGILGKLMIANLSPSLAYKFNDKFSIGAGPDFVRAWFYFNTMLGAPALVPTNPSSLDTLGKVNALGWGKGGHAGMLFQPTPCTRFGLAYHSRITRTLKGSSVASGPLVIARGQRIKRGGFRAETLVLPAFTSLSAYHEFTPRWAMDATLNWTQWSQVPGILVFRNVAGSTPTTPITFSVPQHYRNTWYLAVGGLYRINECWYIKGALSYDQTPVKDRERNVIIPDGNRVGVHAGAHYQALKNLGFDIGYTHLFVQDVKVNLTTRIASQLSTATGNFDSSSADVFGVQVVWDF